MKVLVINCGSSSIKYELFAAETEQSQARGLVEAIGSTNARHTHELGPDGRASVSLPADCGYEQGVQAVVEALCGRGPAGESTGAAIGSPAEIQAVGHRVVHGGEKLTAPAVISDDVLGVIEANNELAPLHNPANLAGIRAACHVLPDATHVAVMDTAFHAAMPQANRQYPIPWDWHARHRIYRYGFHGSSHQFVSEEAARALGKQPADAVLVTCHLGNGCTIAAIKGGRTLDISMGFTPLEGLMMGTRSGSIDPAIVQFLVERKGIPIDEVFAALQKQSGLLGISGVSNDMRQVVEAADAGNHRCRLAVDMFVTRCKHWIGGLLAELGSPADAIVFTGGIGQFNRTVRGQICGGLEPLGITMDPSANQAATGRGVEDIAASDSPVRILVIATNEELVIARAAARLATSTP